MVILLLQHIRTSSPVYISMLKYLLHNYDLPQLKIPHFDRCSELAIDIDH